jgi:hypothetical protein
VDWLGLAAEKAARYEDGASRLDPADEKALIRQGNVAWAAGLALLMGGDPDGGVWLRRAAAHWRESWDAGACVDSWGRPIGAIKASLLAHDDAAVEELARWALELGTATADSPIGRYAGSLALLALGRTQEARHVAASLTSRDDFPPDVAEALVAVATGDEQGLRAGAASVVRSFETRAEFLEDVPVADTALVLAELGRRAGLDAALPASQTLPG